MLCCDCHTTGCDCYTTGWGCVVTVTLQAGVVLQQYTGLRFPEDRTLFVRLGHEADGPPQHQRGPLQDAAEDEGGRH